MNEHITYGEFYIPDRMMGGIRRYVDHGIKPGSFLTAVICNDFVRACGTADDENLRNLPAYADYFYNEVPGNVWGSKEKMDAWVLKKEKEREEKDK